jgi:hypothetical protein
MSAACDQSVLRGDAGVDEEGQVELGGEVEKAAPDREQRSTSDWMIVAWIFNP